MKSYFLFLSVVVIGGGLIGCASDQATQRKLVEGKTALERNEFDAAMTSADDVLKSNATPGDSAAGYYLRGRTIEQRVKTDSAAASNDLSLARMDYNRALQLGPTRQLEGYIRASLANVDYFMDDYPNAYGQWQAAYNLLSEPDLKAWTLYRIGLCQQRMGRFEQADRTFTEVGSRFPNSEQAKYAQERIGARGFQVQLATFTNPKSADNAIAELRRDGITPTRTTDARGLSIIRIGPYTTYTEALQYKHRFATKYADAIILP